MATRDSIWRTGGREIKVKDMDDLHLINTIHYIKESGSLDYFPDRKEIYEVMREEAFKIRYLSKKLLRYAPIPFKKQDGNWAVWNYEKSKLDNLSNKNFENHVLYQNEIDELEKEDYGVDEIIDSLKRIVKGNRV